MVLLRLILRTSDAAHGRLMRCRKSIFGDDLRNHLRYHSHIIKTDYNFMSNFWYVQIVVVEQTF